MKKKILYYSLAISIFSVCSCCTDKEGEDGPLPIINVPQEVKDYMVFKPGTYWIYKDSASGIEDSVFVYEMADRFDTIIQTNGGLKSGIYEWFEIRATSSLDGYNYYYKFNADNQYDNPYYLLAVTRVKTKPGDYVGSIYCFLYPFTIGYQAYTVYDVTTLTAFYPTATFEGNQFANVVKIHETENVTESDQVTNFFFSKNIGIIRKELVDSTKVWNLVRNQIMQ